MDLLKSNQFSPVFVSFSSINSEVERKNKEKWYSLFFSFPIWLRFGLVDLEIDEEIRKTTIRFFGKEDEQKGAEIARIIRGFFTKEVTKENLKEKISNNLKLNNQGEIEKIQFDILRILELINKKGKEKEKEKIDKLPIILALKKYEDLGKQWITFGPIELEREDNLVAPNIKNWLEDYIQKMGSQSHTAIERAKFLFESENARSLNSLERNRLAQILSSYDQDEELFIDKDDQIVIFSSFFDNELKQKKEENNLKKETWSSFINKDLDKNENFWVDKKENKSNLSFKTKTNFSASNDKKPDLFLLTSNQPVNLKEIEKNRNKRNNLTNILNLKSIDK